jgi:hypothetical protein
MTEMKITMLAATTGSWTATVSSEETGEVLSEARTFTSPYEALVEALTKAGVSVSHTSEYWARTPDGTAERKSIIKVYG